MFSERFGYTVANPLGHYESGLDKSPCCSLPSYGLGLRRQEEFRVKSVKTFLGNSLFGIYVNRCVRGRIL